jgi:NhaP-type Na+/H+ or K+/H+ antiporter
VNQKLAIIILVGVVAGMTLAVPTIFMSQTLSGGVVVGLLSGVVGHFTMRKNDRKEQESSSN